MTIFDGEADRAEKAPSYAEEANGAPVETKSPLGYQVGWTTVVLLNLSKMVGIGILSTPATILAGAGSAGLALMFWLFGFLISAASLSIYLEFDSYFPSRSVRYFFPTAFAVQTVIFSFSAI